MPCFQRHVRWQRFQFPRRVVALVTLIAIAVVLVPLVTENPRADAAVSVVRTVRRPARKTPTTRRTVTKRRATTSSTTSSTTSAPVPVISAPATSGPSPLPTLAPATTVTGPVVSTPLPSPSKYLADALAFIERYWVRRRTVDVRAITDRARIIGAPAQVISDLYPILRQTMKDLGDGHSAFLEPMAARSLLEGTSTGFGLKVYPADVIFVVPGSPAEQAGIRTLDRIVSFNGKPFLATTAAERAVETAVIRVNRPPVGEMEFTVRRGELKTAEVPSARALDGRLGYIELPGSTGTADNESAFATAGVAVVGSVEQQISPCGWVLDLRRNSGGFPFSMMSVLEPFFPEQVVGGFVYGDDTREQLRFSGGKVLIDNRPAWSNAVAARLRDPGVPVAVLISSQTASAGEIATIAFIGRPSSRSFGAPTVGVTSANVGIRMPDNSFLMVTHSYDLDRAGKVYDGPINADEPVGVEWSVFGTAQDPVLSAASGWLAAQPSCAGRQP